MRSWILGFLMTCMMSVAWGQTLKIPPRAFEQKATIAKELDTHFPELPERNYVPALIEHESCITLTHSRCWSSTSRLKTSREEGAGLGQITRAYREDGSLRFDSLTDMRSRYGLALKEASWNTIYQRPDIQIRMIVLMLKDSWGRVYGVTDPFERLAFVDASYNGGLGGLNKERRLCSLTKGCDHTRWFGHVEKHCLKSKKVLYGKRSACDINRAHVSLVMKTNLPRYKKYYFVD